MGRSTRIYIISKAGTLSQITGKLVRSSFLPLVHNSRTFRLGSSPSAAITGYKNLETVQTCSVFIVIAVGLRYIGFRR